MTEPIRKLTGHGDLGWLIVCTAVCALFVGVLLRFLAQRHEVYRLGYEVAALTEEHSLLLEENRRLTAEAAFQGNTERLEGEALERLGLRDTASEQVLEGNR